MNDELIYLMALTRVLPYQSQVQRMLLDAVGSATKLYEARTSLRDLVPDATDRLAATVAQMGQHLERARQEMDFALRNQIRIIALSDADYPARLRECPDAPIVLFYRGTADLNSRYILSMVGTRKATEYGKTFCQHFMRDLAQLCPDALVVSGLAYGIDINSHRQALANRLQTIGVLAHGLDQIYPRLHRQTAIEMLRQGGLLTEFMSGSTAEKVNFVSRNRIVAGMADATIVVESADRGGSLITARIATEYNRDVFAVPGRIGDTASAGCNQLIRDNRAGLLETAEDFVVTMGWATLAQEKRPVQRELFPTLSPDEMVIFEVLKDSEGKHLNLLSIETHLPVGRLSSLLFDMEMRGLVRLMSGGMYRWV